MTTTPALAAALAGTGLGLSLIVAIGPQNAFVLRQGLRREHVGVVVTLCLVSDAVLIVAGVAGAGGVLAALPWLEPAVRVAGAVFLAAYAVLAARRALRPSALRATEGGPPAALGPVVATTLALTWLSPHVYLDTVVLLGSVANGHGDDRWWFAGGAVVASTLWFVGLGQGARLLRPVFARPSPWRVVDGVIAVVMPAIAVSLVVGL